MLHGAGIVTYIWVIFGVNVVSISLGYELLLFVQPNDGLWTK